jgi:hypothetical protein
MRDRVAVWKIGTDAWVALLTVTCVIVRFLPDCPQVPCSAMVVAVLIAGAWTAWRSAEEYRGLVRTGEIASRGDRVAAVVTTVACAALYVPAWVLAWRLAC